VITKKGVVIVILGVYGHAQHRNFVAHALLQLHQGRHFRDTRRAVRRPEIQNHDLAPVVMEGDCVFGIGDREIWCRAANHPHAGLLGAAKAAGQTRGQNGPKQ